MLKRLVLAGLAAAGLYYGMRCLFEDMSGVWRCPQCGVLLGEKPEETCPVCGYEIED